MKEADEGVVDHDKLEEDWPIVEKLLPEGWQAKARELGALRRGRDIKDAATLLRIMLIHLADGCGLRETAVRARLSGLAQVSDVAILKRLKGCGAWFEWMVRQIQRRLIQAPASIPMTTRALRVIDGTMVSEPGDTGSRWRLHYSIRLPELHCDEVILTIPKEGETLKRFSVNAGDILLGDRGYAHPPGIAYVVDAKADVIIRANLVTLPMTRRDGRAFDILAQLRPLAIDQVGDWPVSVRAARRLIPGRLCAIKKSATAAARARLRVARESQRGQSKVQPQTLEAADYVFVFTTLDDGYSACQVLELYRARWQIELTFKRLKSLVSLGHLKKHDSVAARAWLQGKLLVAFLIDTLLATAEHLSPWGYEFTPDPAQPVRVAGDFAHA